MQEIDFIKLKISSRNGNTIKMYFNGFEELNAYINDKYKLNEIKTGEKNEH